MSTQCTRSPSQMGMLSEAVKQRSGVRPSVRPSVRVGMLSETSL